jgi:hypothetical protein
MLALLNYDPKDNDVESFIGLTEAHCQLNYSQTQFYPSHSNHNKTNLLFSLALFSLRGLVAVRAVFFGWLFTLAAFFLLRLVVVFATSVVPLQRL